MRLTDWQKSALDSVLSNILEENMNAGNSKIKLSDYMGAILDGIGLSEISLQSIIASVNRINERPSMHNFGAEYKQGNVFIGLPIIYLTGNFIKEKNLLIFEDFRNTNSVVYDFIKKSFVDETITKRIYNPYSEHGFLNGIACDNYIQQVILSLVDNTAPEWIFNYLNTTIEISSLLTSFSSEELKECPKGFIPYLEETDSALTPTILRRFMRREKYGVFGVNLMESLHLDEEDFDTLIKSNIINDLKKILINDIKSGIINEAYEIERFVRLWLKIIHMTEDSANLIDTSKGIRVNAEYLQDILYKAKNEALAKKLQKLNFINGIKFADLIVVVPQNQEEKKVEGEMQHNCVGHYYDNSILADRDLIYFIRKQSKPNESYVTCRYNINTKKTVEFRGFGNSLVRDNNVYNFIEGIDSLINKANL